jgi:hypothetical protein
MKGLLLFLFDQITCLVISVRLLATFYNKFRYALHLGKKSTHHHTLHFLGSPLKCRRLHRSKPQCRAVGRSLYLQGQVFSLFEGKCFASSAAKVWGWGCWSPAPCPLPPVPSDTHAMVHHQNVLIEIKTCGSICIQFPLALVVCGF